MEEESTINEDGSSGKEGLSGKKAGNEEDVPSRNEEESRKDEEMPSKKDDVSASSRAEDISNPESAPGQARDEVGKAGSSSQPDNRCDNDEVSKETIENSAVKDVDNKSEEEKTKEKDNPNGETGKPQPKPKNTMIPCKQCGKKWKSDSTNKSYEDISYQS